MLQIDYFSDTLCVWAFIGQVRLDELQSRFAEQLHIRYRFVPIFGSAHSNVENNWAEQGGFDGFNRHLREVTAEWPHVQCSEQLWLKCRPATSIASHEVLKAVWLLQEQQRLHGRTEDCEAGKDLFETLLWQVRKAFFQDDRDISDRAVLRDLVESLHIDWQDVQQLLDSGRAQAALFEDQQLRQEYGVQGSPCLVLNEGRQVLYGNVGYRIIEANIHELLYREDHAIGASWC